MSANNSKTIASTGFDRCLYRAVAAVKGGTGHYEKITAAIKAELGPRMPSKFIKGTAEPTPEEARFIVSILSEYDPAITIHDIIDP